MASKMGLPAPLVIVGPSGVGKGTLIGKILEKYKDKFGYSVSHTTRAPRPGEVDGQHYHFMHSVEQMEEQVKQGMFIEHAKVHANLYGTSREGVLRVQREGKICILEIDVQGADQVKESRLDPDPKFVFIKPPSMEVLEARLRGRNTETEEKITVRLNNALKEMQYLEKDGYWDFVVTNDEIESAVGIFEKQLMQWYPEVLQ